YRFTPEWSNQWTLPRKVWRQHELTGFRVPQTCAEFAQAAELLECLSLWLAEYESQIVEDLGREYRCGVVSEWGQLRKPTIPADRIVSHWQAIANGDWNTLLTSRQEAA
ncbi:MAG: hypothetical protein KDA84_22795, partial [Planctomycetaceae bacterium]|nr:hypothetical protein [Planctomycetaceae bacterium]